MEQHRQQLLSAPIPSLIVQKAMPMSLGILSILFFNLVDTFFIAMLGTDALAAISFTFPITFIITSLIMGLGIGLSSLVSRLLGAKQQQQAAELTRDSLIFTLLFISTIAGIAYLTIHPLFLGLGAELGVMTYIEQYMQIWYLSVPLLAIPMVGNSAIRASGDSLTPSIVMLVAGGVNGLLDPLLIFGLGPIPAMGVKGAALATAIAWLLTLLVAIYILRVKLNLLVFSFPKLSLMFKSWKTLLHIAIPASISQLMAPLATMIIMLILAKHGTATVAAYGLATRIEALLLIGVMAVSSTIPMLVGQNIGAGNVDRAKDIVNQAIRLAVLGQLSLAILSYLFSYQFGHWLSSDPHVAELCSYYLKLLPFSYAMIAVPLLLAQTLNAMTKPLLAMGINFIRLFLLLIPAVWLSEYWTDSKVSFIAMTLAHTVAGLLSLAALSYVIKSKRWWLK